MEKFYETIKNNSNKKNWFKFLFYPKVSILKKKKEYVQVSKVRQWDHKALCKLLAIESVQRLFK